MPPGARILEEQRARIAQIEHHDCVGHGGFGNVGSGFRHDGGRAIFLALFGLFGLGRGEDRVRSLFLRQSVGGLAVPVLHAALVAAQLLFDLAQRLIEALVNVMRFAMALEDKALVDVRDDVAGISAGPGLAEGDVRAERTAEVFFHHGLQLVGHIVLQGGAGVDLMARDADIHKNRSPCLTSSMPIPAWLVRRAPPSRSAPAFPKSLQPQWCLHPPDEFGMARQFGGGWSVGSRFAARADGRRA